ncbi:MAG: hypothetical protein ACSLFF_04595 [Solirubrobacterales bacterium]
MSEPPETQVNDLDSLLDRVAAGSPHRGEIASRLVDWVRDNSRLRTEIWTTESGGSLRVFAKGQGGYAVFKLTADGKIEILFDTLKNQPVETFGCSLEEFRTSLNQIPQVEIAKSSLETWKTIRLEAVGQAAEFERFAASIDLLVA